MNYRTPDVLRIEHRDRGTVEITVDGQPFPYTVSREIDVEVDPPSLVLRLFAERIEVVNNQPQVPPE